MDGFLATPEWERFTGTAQGSSPVWARAHEGVLAVRNREQANNNLISLNIHLNWRGSNLITIES
jgi:hypothetical protein